MRSPKRRRPTSKTTGEIKRTNTKIFNFCDKRVCQSFFLKTLSISNGPLISAFKNKNEFTNFFEGSDQRGRREPSNKLGHEVVDSIVNFLNEKCIAETTGKFKKKIVCDGSSKSLRNFYDDYKASSELCPSYTSFKKIFYENNFSLPHERLRQKPVKQESSQEESKIQVHNVEILNLDPSENHEEQILVNNFQQSAEVYEIQFVIPASSL